VLSASRLGENAVLLDLAIEAFQRSLKRLIFANLDFRQQDSPPSRPGFEMVFAIASERVSGRIPKRIVGVRAPLPSVWLNVGQSGALAVLMSI
jgi:hypothetical protein